LQDGKTAMSKIFKGFIIGAIIMLVVCFLVLAAFDVARYNREAEIIKEKINETEELLEDYGNRNAYEFLDDTPSIRGAADSGREQFRKQRDEILQRFGGSGDSR
jgi:gas vesicle protein